MNEVRRYTIKGDTPSQKNNKQIFYNKATNRPFITSSAKVKAWQEDALWQLKTQKKEDWTYPLAVSITFYFSTLRPRDLDNCASSVLDVLVRSQIIQDDNYKSINQLHLYYGGLAKQEPKAEILVEEV